jgi:hypothetical protein
MWSLILKEDQTHELHVFMKFISKSVTVLAKLPGYLMGRIDNYFLLLS